MFDVKTVRTPLEVSDAVNITTSTPDGITVVGLNILTPLRESLCVELYTKAGSFDDAAFDSEQWTFLGSFSLMGQGPSAPTSIPLGSFDPIQIGLDQTQAFYVTTQNEKLRYTALDPDEYMTGDVYVTGLPQYDSTITATGRGGGNGKRVLQTSDGLAVEILTGVAKNYPFAESWPHRVFNGALLYTLGMDSSTSFLSDAQLETAQAVKRGSVTCDVDAVAPEPTANPSNAPTPSPSKLPTPIRPSRAPTPNPTSSPTTLQSTIKKAATTLHGGLKQAGMMFDIVVPSVADGGPSEGLTVIAFELSTFLTDEVCVEVYSKSGTYVGFERDDVVLGADGTGSSTTWDVLGAATVIGKGESGPTHIPIGALDPVFVAAGERHAFYITMTEPEMRYTQPRFGEQVGDVFSNSPDGDVKILVGSAVAYPFAEKWDNRIFNGAVVYAHGDIGDSKYNEMNSGGRRRRCVEPTVSQPSSPTMAPTSATINSVVEVEPTEMNPPADNSAVTDETEEEVTTSNESGTTDVDDSPPNQSPVTGGTSTQDDYQAAGYTGRLADLCPESGAALVTMNVVVPYEYTFITASGAETSTIVTEIENALHSSLIADMCPAVGEKMRLLQATATYMGFNSNPADQAEGCGEEVTVDEGEECHLVSGGVTAVIEAGADIAAVMNDMESYIESILSDPAFFESSGAQQVSYKAPKIDYSATDEDLPIEDNLAIDAAEDENQNPAAVDSNATESKSLSTAGVTILVVVACALVVALLALIVHRVRRESGKKRTRANSLELFHEFPDEEDHVTFSKYGVHASSSAGFDENLAPVSSKGRSRRSPPPPPPPSTLPSKTSAAYSQAAVILNDADDISLFSDDRDKPRFGGGRTRTDSTGSLGSRGSKGSNKSVEFIRAGQTFSSGPNVPEDTVDL
ncbi:hypothetical protein ACHAW5_001256 [Stephanodiscus triporus]|uniref:Uncharacterized protein n=1 Tax=Stephanodiscus triporus TaxID=2934178 RepID=A0ABD3QHR0_9STRA